MVVKIIIYKITNKINGKIYIGQTIQKLNRRVSDHVAKSKKCGKKTVFASAIKKYGIENFDITVIDKAETRAELNEKEILHIANFNSLYPNGYNLDKGGNSRSWNIESRLKLSESKRNSKKQIRINVFGFNSAGEIIKEFKDIKTARKNGVKLPMKNQLESKVFAIEHDGLIYTTKKELFDKFIEKVKIRKMKAIMYFDKEGTLIGEFKTTLEMEKITGIKNTGISLVLRGKQKVFADNSFCLYQYEVNDEAKKERMQYVRPKAAKEILMFNKEEKVVFKTAKEASEKTGLNRQLIAIACKCEKNYKNYNWKYV